MLLLCGAFLILAPVSIFEEFGLVWCGRVKKSLFKHSTVRYILYGDWHAHLPIMFSLTEMFVCVFVFSGGHPAVWRDCSS